ncbi:hypothetical protein BC830DRAFT_920103 [Chytriomyces sp. MP71]|nr:hypothetical protein BC830DRAFT_920103 [Chytriomyces sp. MP71]
MSSPAASLQSQYAWNLLQYPPQLLPPPSESAQTVLYPVDAYSRLEIAVSLLTHHAFAFASPISRFERRVRLDRATHLLPTPKRVPFVKNLFPRRLHSLERGRCLLLRRMHSQIELNLLDFDARSHFCSVLFQVMPRNYDVLMRASYPGSTSLRT